ncbi:hypothetical protein [Xylella fastidiosa]|uniref:Uncharacterized protein n=1 Tax=Xylella fastidiosa subsp. multiplex TaxID=644357 RepID=A0A9Q4MGM5_XYLFS|nr:hypothetical protein [Xylella fastidiosa]ERI59459.1 hypothetical protein M233_09405 [Xylella fastidiosa subsp. multiplex Griffin-1]ACA11872.1 hypothetical protein Xfasm12_0887 [Xylella fastidiosa M12]KAJ4852860.1 hypothetical protein XYFPCFBP8418_000915 [Xylella fastidiosa subsp. multiplex]KFA41016.1 hypothetical protein DF22_002180 [Xylella fastidiosa]MBE0268963.1 hypothetical protein [Xylella fastidiosa subsp. multiplex]
MDATLIALISTTVIAIATVVAAIINTFGHIKVSRESEAKEKLRDDLDRLKVENDYIRKNLVYLLRQCTGYHQLEDIYFKQRHPNESDTKKSIYRRQANDLCGIYPRMSKKECQEYIDKIKSGQDSYSLIDVAIKQEQENSNE